MIKNTLNAYDIKQVQERLDYLRQQIVQENISYGEIAELQGLKDYINPDDVLLLEWAGAHG